MSFTITIDKRKVLVEEGCTLIDAAADNGVFIPNLCYMRGKPCLGTCRVCSVRVNGKVTASCTVAVEPGMVVEVAEPEAPKYRSKADQAKVDLAAILEDTLNPHIGIVDWTSREDVQKEMRRLVKRQLRASQVSDDKLDPMAEQLVDLLKRRHRR